MRVGIILSSLKFAIAKFQDLDNISDDKMIVVITKVLNDS